MNDLWHVYNSQHSPIILVKDPNVMSLKEQQINCGYLYRAGVCVLTMKNSLNFFR